MILAKLEVATLAAGEAPLLDQGSLYLLLERVGVLPDFQLVYSQLAASCFAMAAAVASFQDPKKVCNPCLSSYPLSLDRYAHPALP